MTTSILIFTATAIVFAIIATIYAVSHEKRSKGRVVLLKSARHYGNAMPGYQRKKAKHHYR